jgi:hypothetical protein
MSPAPTFKAAVVCLQLDTVGPHRTQWRIFACRAEAAAALAQPCPFPDCIGVHAVACLDRYAGRRVVT